jgi:catechol 2,3-dioxygenase-like lactoylglutathione lyase family enzyme
MGGATNHLFLKNVFRQTAVGRRGRPQMGEDNMRLRQVALVARSLQPAVADLETILGLKVAYRDPAVAIFGLVNAVLPVGGDFLEIVQPVREDASAARYLERRGGDAGYMAIFQVEDAVPHRERLRAAGVRVIHAMTSPRYTYTHFHPAEFAGVLTSIDSVGGIDDWREPYGDWPPASDAWRSAGSDPNLLGIAGIAIQSRTPTAAARRWGELLQVPVETSGDSNQVSVDGAAIRFVEPMDANATGIVGLDIAVRDPAPVLAAAKQAGISVAGLAVRIGGVWINLVQRVT